jgi:UDP-GlcNAc:undecaprenyl-phosphate GlcNAc-1-phosphate transferase
MASVLELGGAFVLGLWLTALSRPVARKLGVVARASDDRWHHSGEIPRLAGPALWLAVAPWIDWRIAIALALFCVIGVRDDLQPLAPLTKGLLLLLPCAVLGVLLGELSIALVAWLSANAFNMLDHADTTATSTSAASLLVAQDDLGLAGAGASLGFLVHNWPPARVFLGDGGSLMLGALLAAAWYPHGALATLAGLAVPLLDSLFVVASRLKRGIAPWHGGTDHTGHRLLAAGVDPRWLPMIYAGTAGSVALAGKLYL